MVINQLSDSATRFLYSDTMREFLIGKDSGFRSNTIYKLRLSNLLHIRLFHIVFAFHNTKINNAKIQKLSEFIRNYFVSFKFLCIFAK